MVLYWQTATGMVTCKKYPHREVTELQTVETLSASSTVILGFKVFDALMGYLLVCSGLYLFM